MEGQREEREGKQEERGEEEEQNGEQGEEEEDVRERMQEEEDREEEEETRRLQPATPSPAASPPLAPATDEATTAGGPSWAAVLRTLGPDHPLLRGFQEAKRRQLLEERSQLRLRLRQLKQQTQDLKAQNVALGAQLFDVQQEVTRVQVNLDKVKNERKQTREAAAAAEEGLRQARQEEKSLLAALTSARKHEAEVKREIERLGAQVATMRVAREKSDGDVTTTFRVLHNTAWDRANLEKDKMMQDLVVERMTAALEREKTTLAALKAATQEERDLTAALKEKARRQRQELQHLECEGVGVKRAWEAGVVRLSRQAEEQAETLQHLEELRAQLAGMRTEMHKTRKSVKEKQLEHEVESTRLLSWSETLPSNESVWRRREESQRLAEKHEELSAVVERLESRCGAQHKKENEATKEVERLYGKVRAATARLRKVEDQALEKLGENTAATRAARNLRRGVAQARTKCRTLEDELVERERAAAAMALKVWDARAAVQGHTASRDALNNLVSRLDMDVTRLEKELKRGHEHVKTNQSTTDRLNKELAKVLELTGGSEAPPAEREERRLRLLLQDRESEKRVLEEEALGIQRNLLQAKATRDSLLQLTTRLQQELDVVRAREARLEGSVERERGALREAEKQRQRLHGAVSTLDARIHQEQQLRDATSREADAAETYLTAKLQDLEQEATRRETEAERLREKREALEEALLEATKERTDWERHLDELRDVQETIRKERGDQGELHAMKTEINRMQARWRTLEATQKELSSRLEQSVNVESALKTRTQALVKRLRHSPHAVMATRLMHQDILKRKLAQGRKRLREVEEKAGAARDERGRVEGEARRQEQVYAHNVRLLQEAAAHLEDKLITKQEEQLRLQECRARLRHLTAVREGRYKTLAAAGEEAQQAVRGRLMSRAQSYTSVTAQLEAGYPQMKLKLRNIKVILHNFLE